MSIQFERKLNYFVLAGTSGTGKTTVLNCLRDRGFTCFDEAARSVLEEQLAVQGPALPSNNPLLFVQTMLAQNRKDFALAGPQEKPVFFDRGMPDLVHYAIRFNVDIRAFEEASRKHPYNQNVFLFTPWKEIFVNDSVRKMTFEKSIEFHELLVKVYQDLEYNLVEVPFGSVEARVNFVLEKVHAQKTSDSLADGG